MSDNPRCPVCNEESVPIIYGLVGSEVGEAAERGEVAIGGCLIWPDNPRWQCKGDPPHQWGADPDAPPMRSAFEDELHRLIESMDDGVA